MGKTVQLTEQNAKLLEVMSKKNGQSMSSLVNNVMDVFLQRIELASKDDIQEISFDPKLLAQYLPPEDADKFLRIKFDPEKLRKAQHLSTRRLKGIVKTFKDVLEG